jgi:hypothetical protein
MALRVYSDREGGEWRVWRVVPEANSASTLVEVYRDGWLCFERVDGGERRRLSMTQVPPGWETASDKRLDALRRLAEPATRRSVAAKRVAGDGESGTIEPPQRAARPSGPRSAFGGEDTRD